MVSIYIMSVRLLTSDVNFAHLVNGVSARLLRYKVLVFLLVINNLSCEEILSDNASMLFLSVHLLTILGIHGWLLPSNNVCLVVIFYLPHSVSIY